MVVHAYNFSIFEVEAGERIGNSRSSSATLELKASPGYQRTCQGRKRGRERDPETESICDRTIMMLDYRVWFMWTGSHDGVDTQGEKEREKDWAFESRLWY